MTAFTRNDVPEWHVEVPGSRWFHADLHLHTLDDHPGGVVWQVPPALGQECDPCSPSAREAYARAFLHAASNAGIEVLGLTPHCAHLPGHTDLSATWDIVEAWQSYDDDDGIPFRRKIYAVFPGFEPNTSDGSHGVHFLVLFDPEIGKERYLKAFAVATGGHDVWRENALHPSPRRAEELLSALSDLRRRESDGWDYLTLAPHAFGKKGVFQSLRGDIGKYFPYGEIAGIELSDNHLIVDAYRAHDFVESHLRKYGQSLFHASDAYCLDCPTVIRAEVPVTDSPKKRGIGYRYTLVKLASARIESLRQAFLSGESRLQLAYERSADKQLQYRSNVPSPTNSTRPWLRSVTVEGGASFFGGKGRKQVMRFSPDLTCIIGGRMTGKSTLLDGLRCYFKALMPQDGVLARDVEARSLKFLAGDPAVVVDIVGPIAATLSSAQRWPARFFTQRELAGIANDPDNSRRSCIT
jgi:hypothetical protein